MKITLNLLPKSRERKLTNKKVLKLFLWQESALIFIVLFLFGITLGTNEIIKIKMDSIENQSFLDSPKESYAEIKKYEDYLKNFKSDVYAIEKVQKNITDWVFIIQKVSENIPEGIAIKSVSNEGFKVSMSGVADSRDNLIKMKSQMEEIGCFEEVLIPINDIVLRENIDFKIDFKVSKNCLSKYEE
ncbi:MAG: hypothetical protein PHH24_03785 [Candidatus Moranbacteria bacterium]|jgi:type IV pilus assembly protein PilN|nr:hypothetical protein [Candidatus Moranbacteria bacterium]MDD5652356.1 hypothetical protein [Candidatus Moranbacteria bacterium]MDX9855367.1 hypothetical protein [Candidatus Moranbacteria bacterium]